MVNSLLPTIFCISSLLAICFRLNGSLFPKRHKLFPGGILKVKATNRATLITSRRSWQRFSLNGFNLLLVLCRRW